jgi:fibronectin type 3 domain-containing protein
LKDYNIYRAEESGGPYTKIDTVIDSEYINTGLTNGTTYYYVVTAVDENDNESDYSPEVNATPTS